METDIISRSCSQLHANQPADAEHLLIEHLMRRSHAGADLKIGISANNGAHTNELLLGVSVALDLASERGLLPDGAELHWENDGRDPAVAAAVAQEFCHRKLDFVIGHLSASASLAASTIYHANRVCFFAPATSHPALSSDEYNTLFRLCPRDDEQGVVIADFCRNRLGCDELVIIAQDIAYGVALRMAVVDAWPGSTSSISLPSADTSRLNDSDIDRIRSKVGEDKRVGIILCGVHEVTGCLVRQLRDASITIPIIVGDDARIDGFLKLCGLSAEGVYVVGIRSHQLVLDPPLISSDWLEEKYRTCTGSEAGAYFETSFWSMWVLLSAYSALSGGGVLTLADYIRNRVWQTTLGHICFGDNVDAEGVQWTMLSISDGQFSAT